MNRFDGFHLRELWRLKSMPRKAAWSALSRFACFLHGGHYPLHPDRCERYCICKWCLHSIVNFEGRWY